MEVAEFEDKDEGKIQEASKKYLEIQAIKKNWEINEKEMKGVAVGVCQW